MASALIAPAARSASAGYRHRDPEATPLYRVLAKHLPTFLAEVDGGHTSGLPAFVRRELTAFLDCGILARGFARVRCTGCGRVSTVSSGSWSAMERGVAGRRGASPLGRTTALHGPRYDVAEMDGDRPRARMMSLAIRTSREGRR